MKNARGDEGDRRGGCWLGSARPGPPRLQEHRLPRAGARPRKRRKATQEAVRSPLTPPRVSHAYPARRGRAPALPPRPTCADGQLLTSPSARPERDAQMSAPCWLLRAVPARPAPALARAAPQPRRPPVPAPTLPTGALGGAGGWPRAEVVEVGRLGRGQRARRRDAPAWVRPREPRSDSSPVTGRGPRAPSPTRRPGP